MLSCNALLTLCHVSNAGNIAQGLGGFFASSGSPQEFTRAWACLQLTWRMCGHCRRDQFTLDLMEKVPQGAGSGTIWDTDGHVVTNAHVIAGASDLQVSSPLPIFGFAVEDSSWRCMNICLGIKPDYKSLHASRQAMGKGSL